MSKQTDLINVTDAITVSGSNVGIGTSSPLSRLNLKGTQGNWRVDPDSVSGEIQVLSTTPANDGFRSFRLRSNESIFETNGTERMRITSSGNVGIGISPVTPLDVVTGSNQRFFFTQTNGSPIISAVNKANTAYMPLQLNGLDLRLQVSGTERMRIDSSGNLLVGKTSANATDVGIVANANGRLYATASGDSSIFNRTSSDGDIVQFRKDGSTVGSIGVNSGDQVYFAASDGMGIKVDTDNTSVEASNAAGADNDNAVNLGSSGTRWKDAYLSGGVYLGGTGSANKLDDYEEGNHTTTITPGTSGTVSMNGGANEMSYTKIGRLVTVTGDVRISSVSSPVGHTKMSLPFAVTNTTDLAERGGLVMLVWSGNWNHVTATYSDNQTYIIVDITPAAGLEYRFSFSYITS